MSGLASELLTFTALNYPVDCTSCRNVKRLWNSVYSCNSDSQMSARPWRTCLVIVR